MDPNEPNTPTRKYQRRSHNKGASEPMEQVIGQDNPRAMESTGPARDALEPPLIDPVETVDHKKLDELVFMEDTLTVYVHDSEDPNADPMPMVGNGGDRNIIWLKRGERVQIKRKYVEVLARAKITRYTQKLIKDDLGNDKYIHMPRTTLRIPFSVEVDPAGEKGARWLQGILAEA